MKRFLWLALLALLLVGCTKPPAAPPEPPPSPMAEAEALAAQAHDLAVQEEWAAAVEKARRALEKYPGLAAAQYPLGWALLHTEQWREAEPFLKAASLTPETQFALGLWYEKDAQSAEAIKRYRESNTPRGQEAVIRLATELSTKVPAAPLWGKPGTTVVAEDGSILSQVMQPVPFAGRVLQPLRLEGTTYLMHESEGQLWLDGTLYPMIGILNLNEQPEPVTKLPYALDDVWSLWRSAEDPRVIGFEELETPAGTFPTVVVESEGSHLRQWWAPGVGLVKEDFGGRIRTADRVEQREPDRLTEVRQITPDLTAILANMGIYDQTGRKLLDLDHDKNAGRRPAVGWIDIGAPYPAVRYGTHSQAPPHWKETYYVYEAGAFKPLLWRFPNGSARTQLVGMVSREESGDYSFYDDEAYPQVRYTFRYSGGEMKGIDHQVFHADTEDRFVNQLSRPLSRQSFVGMFADPALGQQAYDAIFKEGRNQLSFTSPSPQADGRWLFPPNLYVRVVPHGKDFRITEFTKEGGLP